MQTELGFTHDSTFCEMMRGMPCFVAWIMELTQRWLLNIGIARQDGKADLPIF